MTDTRKIIDYGIVAEENAAECMRQVQKEIANGWQPFGNFVSDGYIAYQAMVKYEEATG